MNGFGKRVVDLSSFELCCAGPSHAGCNLYVCKWELVLTKEFVWQMEWYVFVLFGAMGVCLYLSGSSEKCKFGSV